MPQFTMSERYLHPEGVYALQLIGWEEKVGKFGPQIKWEFESSVEKEDGTAAKLSYFTSTNFSTDARSKLGKLLAAFNIPFPTTNEDAAKFDPEKLIGKTCRGRVVHAPGTDGTEWANIDGLFSNKPKPGGASPPPQTPEEVQAQGFKDPFADE